MVIPFPCHKCGNCCNMLQREKWAGMSLFPWEKHLFPDEHINPSLGLGTNPETLDFKVILYTYDSHGCRHHRDNQCNIYTTRPLICRSYPFRVKRQDDKNFYIVAPECTVVQSWPQKKPIDQRYTEMDAAELIGDHLSRFYKADEPRWRYKLGNGWTRMGNK
jgi:Fe-S-cluster containining protein